jgi:hypothetical protein
VSTEDQIAYEDALLTRLYRFDCPPAHEIGEYELGLLTPESRVQLASHVLDCPGCADELSTLRVFMQAELPTQAVTLVGSLRRLVATLFTPPAQHALGPALRGGATTPDREYRAGAIRIVLSQEIDPRRHMVALDGLVVHDDVPPDDIANREVRLVPPDGAARTTRTNAGGNFAFDDLTEGTYGLEVHLGDAIVSVDGLTVGS